MISDSHNMNMILKRFKVLTSEQSGRCAVEYLLSI